MAFPGALVFGRRPFLAIDRQRMDHVLGADPFVELIGSHMTERERRLAQADVVAIGLERDLGRLFVADMRMSAVTSISELSRCSLIRCSFGSMPRAQFSSKERQPSARS